MPARLRKLALVLLMLLLPVQGMAGAMTFVLCGPEHGVNAGAHQHAQGDSHDHGAPAHAHDPDPQHGTLHEHDDGDASGYAGHQCCHLSASAIPAAPLPIGAGAAPVMQPRFEPLFSLFVPEQPQRPPRA